MIFGTKTPLELAARAILYDFWHKIALVPGFLRTFVRKGTQNPFPVCLTEIGFVLAPCAPSTMQPAWSRRLCSIGAIRQVRSSAALPPLVHPSPCHLCSVTLVRPLVRSRWIFFGDVVYFNKMMAAS